MKILEVRYDSKFENGIVEQITEKQLERMQKYEQEQQYFSNIEMLRDLGEENTAWIPTWLEIGNKNPWIGEAYDPPFNENSFVECKTVEFLINRFLHGNWCLGSAFYYKDLCFINQVGGGDEWLVIRRNVKFESMSCRLIIERDGEENFKNIIERCFKATDKQLKELKY